MCSAEYFDQAYPRSVNNPFVILVRLGKFRFSHIQYFENGDLTLLCRMDLKERFAWTVEVDHCDDPAVQLPQCDDIFEFHMEDVFVDMPAPVIFLVLLLNFLKSIGLWSGSLT